MFYMCETKRRMREYGRKRVTAGNRAYRDTKSKAKENKMQIQEKLGAIGFASHGTAPFSFTVESI